MNRRNFLRAGIEMLVLFGLLLAVDHGLSSGDAFAGIDPNPYWLPVLVMAIAYGSGLGLAAAGVASAIWLAAPHAPGAGDELEYLLRLSLLPMLWTVVALVVGEVTAARKSTIEEQERCQREAESKQARIADALANLVDVNRTLQVRIASESRTVGDAVAAAAGLLEPDRPSRTAAVERLIALAVQTEDFTFFEVRDRRGVARFRGSAATHRPSELSRSALARSLRAGSFALPDGPVANQRALGGQGIAALPVRNEGERGLSGLLVIHSLAPALLTQSKMAELAHVAETLGRISALLEDEIYPLVPEKWDDATERVA